MWRPFRLGSDLSRLLLVFTFGLGRLKITDRYRSLILGCEMIDYREYISACCKTESKTIRLLTCVIKLLLAGWIPPLTECAINREWSTQVLVCLWSCEVFINIFTHILYLLHLSGSYKNSMLYILEAFIWLVSNRKPYKSLNISVNKP